MVSLVASRSELPVSLKLGGLTLSHRLFVTRWNPQVDPRGLLCRRGALMISEPLVVSTAFERDASPSGLYTSEQVNQWRGMTRAVNQRGGFLCAQLTQSTMPMPSGHRGPSDGDLLRCFEAFRDAAENAIDAGFDGVELAAGPGTVGGQLLGIHSSLTGELLQVLQDVWGSRCCVGMQLGPGLVPPASFELGEQLRNELSWIHVGPCSAAVAQEVATRWRHRWNGALLISGGFDLVGARAVMESGLVNMVGVEAGSTPD